MCLTRHMVMACLRQTYFAMCLTRHMVHIPSIGRWARADLTISCNATLNHLRAIATILCHAFHWILTALKKIPRGITAKNCINLIHTLQHPQAGCAIDLVITIRPTHLTVTHRIVRPGRAEATWLCI